ncbi:MAG: cell division protein FtsZ [Anaerolineales bacterium]
MNAFHTPVIKVLGLGGGGGNAVNRMIELGLNGAEYIAANTDAQALAASLAPCKIQLGPRVTRGLGAGGNPEVGNAAARESARELADALRGADMVFLTAGMGGGTGTGSIPVAAEIARRLGAVTVAIVTTPFAFEAGRRQRNAAQGLTRLAQYTHTMITIPNDQLLHTAAAHCTLDVAFRVADDVLRQGVQGIVELVTQPGLINIDFAHVRRMFRNGGGAFLSIGHGEGEHKALDALKNALSNPLLEGNGLRHAGGILINFTGGDDTSLLEVHEAIQHVQMLAPQGIEIVMGFVKDPQMSDRSQVILVITGLGGEPLAPTREHSADSVPLDAAPSPNGRLSAVTPSAMALEIPAYLRRDSTL